MGGRSIGGIRPTQASKVGNLGLCRAPHQFAEIFAIRCQVIVCAWFGEIIYGAQAQEIKNLVH